MGSGRASKPRSPIVIECKKRRGGAGVYATLSQETIKRVSPGEGQANHNTITGETGAPNRSCGHKDIKRSVLPDTKGQLHD
jgi:hypothetical protein